MMIHTDDDSSNIKVDEIGGACSTHRKENTCINVIVVDLKRETNWKF
jgi:hypothetical protein